MARVHHLARVLLAACAAAGFGAATAADKPPADDKAKAGKAPADKAAAAAPYVPKYVPTKPNRIILLDVAQVGSRLVAVGERGVVMESGDAGATWKAQRTPTTRTLTGVAFNDDKNGIAVGHGGTMLRTADGGATWQAVKLADAGSDSVLGAIALGGTRLAAYGAFGMYLESNDNGQTWARHKVIDDDFDRHISQVIKVGDKYLLIGESATLAVSDDARKWTRIKSPYEGSWFGGLVTKGGAWVIYGMRGNVYRSEDAGANWTKIDVVGQQALMNGRVIGDGRIVLIGVGGLTAISSDDGRSFTRVQGAGGSQSKVLALADGKLLVVGDRGVAKIDAKGAAAK